MNILNATRKVIICSILTSWLWSPCPAKADSGHKGTVIETLEAKRYTYVLITNVTGTAWVVGPKAPISIGQELSTEQGMPMRDFFSQSLDRKFDLIYFVGSLKSKGASGGTSELPKGHPPLGTEKPKKAPNLDLTDIKVPSGGITIADLYARKDALAGKPVTLRGKVFKFLPGILGHNWIHLRDGSGTNETVDLTVTTSMRVEVGDLVTATGRVGVNRTFGHSYHYTADFPVNTTEKDWEWNLDGSKRRVYNYGPKNYIGSGEYVMPDSNVYKGDGK